jgi:hypothetical protein
MPVALGCISTVQQAMDYVQAEISALASVGCAAIQPTAAAVLSFLTQNLGAGVTDSSVVQQAKQMIYDYQCDCRKLRGLSPRPTSVMSNCSSGATAKPGKIVDPDSDSDSSPTPTPASSGGIGLWIGLGAALLFIAFSGGKKVATHVKRRRASRAAA